jgi:hypothetical protein
MRYLVENLDEAQILAIDKLGDVPNCAITSYRLDTEASALSPHLVNFIAPLVQAGAPVTAEADAQAAPKP